MITKIYECPVYDGRTKEWRILNLNSGTVYSSEFNTEEEASLAINEGVFRSKKSAQVVQKTTIKELRLLLDGEKRNV